MNAPIIKQDLEIPGNAVMFLMFTNGHNHPIPEGHSLESYRTMMLQKHYKISKYNVDDTLFEKWANKVFSQTHGEKIFQCSCR